ncbi:MAG: hypothetical protein HOL22_04070 [Euryarchaeota archaeon]|jgi:hypothetical protein|nr:hypothetical protein [Euryarchaeota archaeon]MBT5595149.1 hypothetical protein [Euryarchaeota archaeon]MBT6844765.1 hypothetical protein [Euryarchaeota archaeon]MBT7064274.1 hypothetical protein [Euryarchaeota archaeon]MBT7638455.1 hypothetical protein [Euryarchaeota archaeon]
MRIIEQEEGPASAEDCEVFRALHLAGSGKIRASVDERMLSLETRSGHGLELRLSEISRVHHHHTRLISFFYALLGCGLIYIAKRILIPNTLQIATAVLGIAMILGWFGTRKPTLTLDTEAGGCHTLTGNDASLMRLSTLLKRLESGMGLEEARIGLDILDRDMAFPRATLQNLQEVPVKPVHLKSSPSILSFLGEDSAEQEQGESLGTVNIFADGIDLDFDETESSIAAWMHGEDTNEEPVRSTMEHGLLQRGIANAHDRRGTHASAYPHNIHQNQTQNQFVSHPHAPQPAYLVQSPVPSYQQIIQATNEEIPQEFQASQSTEIPLTYMPSFIGKEGAHIPSHHLSNNGLQTHMDLDTFRSPDAILPRAEIEEHTSLIAKARRETPVVPTIPEQKKTKIHHGNSRLRPKEGVRSNSRLRPKIRSSNGRTARIREFVRPTAAQMIEGATGIASRLLLGRPANNQNTGSSSTRELRQRSAQNHQSEAIESIRNLGISRGGDLPDHEIEPMLAHMIERQAVIDQEFIEEIQEPLPVLDDISFDELKDSKTHHAEHAGKAGLPRLDI